MSILSHIWYWFVTDKFYKTIDQPIFTHAYLWQWSHILLIIWTFFFIWVETMPQMISTVFLILLSFLLMESTTACSCRWPVPISKHFNETDVVFIGRAIKVIVDEPNFQSKAIFYVHDIFKGKCSVRKITIITYNLESMCGFQIRKGEKWQIWAHRSGDNFEANNCDKSTESIYDNIDFLRHQKCSTTTSDWRILFYITFDFSI